MNTNRSSLPFQIEHGLRPEHRTRAAQGYWQAFSRKLRYPLGPETRAIAFIERALDPTHAISAVSSDGSLPMQRPDLVGLQPMAA